MKASRVPALLLLVLARQCALSAGAATYVVTKTADTSD